MAKEDTDNNSFTGLDHADQTRFKVQEIHLLNSFYHDVNHIEYMGNAKFHLNKTLKNENLVEINLNAF